MTRENRIVEKKDLMPQDKYAKIRKKFRKELLDIKKIEEFQLDHMKHFILKTLIQC